MEAGGEPTGDEPIALPVLAASRTRVRVAAAAARFMKFSARCRASGRPRLLVRTGIFRLRLLSAELEADELSPKSSQDTAGARCICDTLGAELAIGDADSAF